jgi:signal transduction histidine kinase
MTLVPGGVFRFRTQLVLLVVATVLPLILFASVMVYFSWRRARRRDAPRGHVGGINEQQAAALNKILARAAEQLTMVTAIMQTTQIEARESVVERRPAEIRSLLADLERDYEVHVVGRQVKISWSYPQDDPLAIVSDGPKIRQILQNLIDNALKFTSEGSVTITARMAAQTPRVLELSVQDTGPALQKTSRRSSSINSTRSTAPRDGSTAASASDSSS